MLRNEYRAIDATEWNALARECKIFAKSRDVSDIYLCGYLTVYRICAIHIVVTYKLSGRHI